MKKTITVFLAALMLLSLAACGASQQPAPEPPAEEAAPDAVALLTAVWGSYADDEKFSVFGGNQDSVDPVMDAPGAFDLGDTMGLDSLLGVPSSDAEKFTDAASLVHMLNTNTFTCGAFHVKSGEDAEALAVSIRDNILQRHWICGCPDKLVVMAVGNYIVSFFGAGELTDTFHAKMLEVFPSAETVCEESIAQ